VTGAARPGRARRRRSQRERAVAYFDGRAPDWSAAYEAPTAAGHALRERRRRVLELVGDADGASDDGDGRVLDAGCGSADLAPGLSSAGWLYFGTDGAPAMVRAAKDAGAGRVTVADVSSLPHASGAFDRVLCIGVLDRVADQPAAVAELVRVTRPGGRVVASFPNPFSPYTAWSNWVFRPAVGRAKALAARARGRGRGQPPGLDAAAFACTPGTATAMFEGAGLGVTDVVHFYFNVLLSPFDELLPGPAARLTARLERLHDGRLAFLGAGFLVAGRRAG
jgi:SAM-dependent methyltransferase